MVKTHIFVVFHKFIFDKCYNHIPQSVLDEHFTFIAVNENIPKTYTPGRYKVINEWDLPVYDPECQKNGMNENSVIYHVWANNLHLEYDYVGFFQYDMEFKENVMDLVDQKADGSAYFAAETHPFRFCALETGSEVSTMQFVIQDYEQHFKTGFNFDRMYPLLNTYIIPVSLYSKIMPWVHSVSKKIWPWCNRPPNQTHFGHYGGILERVMAFAVGGTGNATCHIVPLIHDHEEYKAKSY